MESTTMNPREVFRRVQITMPTLASVDAGLKGSTVSASGMADGYVTDRDRAGVLGDVRVPATAFIDTFAHVSRSALKRPPT